MLWADHAMRLWPPGASAGSLMSREAADELICVVDKTWFLRWGKCADADRGKGDIVDGIETYKFGSAGVNPGLCRLRANDGYRTRDKS
jgi:hypothetical protein